jgi:hypothetical protein
VGLNILDRVGGLTQRVREPAAALDRLEPLAAELDPQPADRRALAVSRLQQETGNRVEVDWRQSDGTTWTMRGTNAGVRVGSETGRTQLVVRLRMDRQVYVMGRDKDQPCHDYLIDMNTVTRVAGGLPLDEESIEPEPGPKEVTASPHA